jgi:hypothetical protein
MYMLVGVPTPLCGSAVFQHGFWTTSSFHAAVGLRAPSSSVQALRANELRPGGRLVIVVPGANEDGSSGFENIMNHANVVLNEMVDEGTITADERGRVALSVWPRSKRDLVAPFAEAGRFRNLVVESCDMSGLPDAAWVEYERGKNTEALVNKHVTFYRSTFVPCLTSALTHSHDAEARQTFADRLE